MSLFGTLIYEKRQTPEEITFQNENIELLLAFPSIVNGCFQYKATDILPKINSSSRDRNLHAVLMSGLLKGKLIEMFPEYCSHATHGRFRLRTSKGEWIYIKKLDDKLRPMNIETEETLNIINQVSHSKTDRGANVFLGYTTNKDNSLITGVHVLCIDGAEEVWRIDLDWLVAKQGAIRKQMSAEVKETKLKDGIVKLKEKKDGSSQL